MLYPRNTHTNPVPYFITIMLPKGELTYEVGYGRHKIATFYERSFAMTFYEWLCKASSDKIAELMRDG